MRHSLLSVRNTNSRFQFLGIPPKGELSEKLNNMSTPAVAFPISRDPPEGGTFWKVTGKIWRLVFPISRDPPEGGTKKNVAKKSRALTFPISRDPPEGGTLKPSGFHGSSPSISNF